MSTLAYIIVFSFIGSVISLIGGIALLWREKLAVKISHYLSAYAAGALLGAAFFDLLPEAMHLADAEEMLIWVLAGIMFFFTLERFITWFHHHHEHAITRQRSIVSLVIFGDTIHNFIDGVVIGISFLVSIPLGVVTTLAVAAHEIPQEIGDFGILLSRGLKRKNIIKVNILSALASVVGAILAYFVGSSIEAALPIFLAITAGFFIYIALSDLIPEIHLEEKRTVALTEALLLIIGILTIWGFVSFLGEH